MTDPSSTPNWYARFVGRGYRRFAAPGTCLFRQGDKPDCLFAIESGVIALRRQESDGQEIIIGWKGPFTLLGTAPVLSGSAWRVAGDAAMDCLIHCLRPSEFARIVSEDSSIAAEVQRLQAVQICEQQERMARFACLSARKRLEYELLELVSTPAAVRLGNSGEFRVAVKHADLAKGAAITPESLSRLLCLLERQMILRRTKGWLALRADLLAPELTSQHACVIP